MQDYSELKTHTDEFFRRHWNIGEPTPLWSEPYIWSAPYTFKGPWPNHMKRGCYTFFAKGEVVYVGVAASRVEGIYKNHGLANRSSHYMKAIGQSEYRFKDKKWKEIEEIRTIGFEPEYSYLSYALEVFLITRLNPLGNKTHKGNSASVAAA